jgi:hypothetical protein
MRLQPREGMSAILRFLNAARLKKKEGRAESRPVGFSGGAVFFGLPRDAVVTGFLSAKKTVSGFPLDGSVSLYEN